MMSWSRGGAPGGDARNHASAAEIVACFEDQGSLLHRLAYLITADEEKAERALTHACEITLQGNGPFRNWLLEWAKVATISAAISLHRDAIRTCEAAYRDRACSHLEHLSEIDDDCRKANFALLMQLDAQTLFSELDALCRAILVLRIAIRSSLQDCSLRLNVSRTAIALANCHAMTWIDHCNVGRRQDGNNVSSPFCTSNLFKNGGLDDDRTQ